MKKNEQLEETEGVQLKISQEFRRRFRLLLIGVIFGFFCSHLLSYVVIEFKETSKAISIYKNKLNHDARVSNTNE